MPKLELTVTGRVTLQSGESVSGITINVYRDGYQLETFLASTTTNAQGVYKLNYDFDSDVNVVDRFNYAIPLKIEIVNEDISICKVSGYQNTVVWTKNVVIPLSQNAYTLNKSEIKTALSLIEQPLQDFIKRVLSNTERAVVNKVINLSGIRKPYEQTREVFELLNDAVFHSRLAYSKKRIAILHENLMNCGYNVAKEAVALHIVDNTTYSCVRRITDFASNYITQSDLDKIEESALAVILKDEKKARGLLNDFYQSKKLVSKRKKITVETSANTSMAKANRVPLDSMLTDSIKEFQAIYKLKATSVLDLPTYRRLRSVLAGRGLKKNIIKSKKVSQLAVAVGNLKLNVVDKEEVNKLQDCLCYMNYSILESEYNIGKFGSSTKKAIEAYQKDNELPITGKYDRKTRVHFIKNILSKNPKALTQKYTHQVRGTIRDEYWKEMKNMRLTAYMVDYNGKEHLLNTRVTPKDGFYNIPFVAPKNAAMGSLEHNFTIYVKLSEAWQPDVVLAMKYVHVKERTTYVNFTAELVDGIRKFTGNYSGEDEYANITHELKKSLGTNYDSFLNNCNKSISVVSREAKLTEEQVFNFVLAHRVCKDFMSLKLVRETYQQLKDIYPDLTAEVIYAFLSQNVLGKFNRTIFKRRIQGNNEDYLGNSINRIYDSFMYMSNALISNTLNNALNSLRVGRTIAVKKQYILEQFALLKGRIAARKVLDDNRYSFNDLLIGTCVEKKYKNGCVHPFVCVGMAFCETYTINETFIDNVINKLNLSSAESKTFRTYMLCSLIVRNNKYGLKKVVDKYNGQYLGRLTMLTQNNWNSFGCNISMKDDIESQLNKHYPSEYFVSRVLRKFTGQKYADLSKLKVLYNAMMLENSARRFSFFSTVQVDKYVYKDKDGEFAKDYVKMLQRVRRITDVPAVAVALINLGITNASKAFFMGKDLYLLILGEYDSQLKKDDIISSFNRVEQLYAQILSTYTRMCDQVQLPAAIGKNVPNLRNIFGTLDYYGTENDMSLLGAPAYLTDLLRFLDEIPCGQSTNGVKSLLDVLLVRRDDIQNIKLNSQNAQGIVPYIDLVCYTLEKYIFKNEKLRSDELKETYPIQQQRENIAKVVYKYLASSNKVRLNPYFSLPERRNSAYLEFMGVPRYMILEVTGTYPAKVAAEYFGMSYAAYQSFIDFKNEDNTPLEGIHVTFLMKLLDMSYGEVLEMLKYMEYTVLQSSVSRNADITLQVVHQKDKDTDKYTLGEILIIRRLQLATRFSTRELFRLLQHPLIGNKKWKTEDDRLNLLSELYAFKQIMSQLKVSAMDAMELFGGECENRVPRENVSQAVMHRLIKDYDDYAAAYPLPINNSPSRFLSFWNYVDCVKSAKISPRIVKDFMTLGEIGFKTDYEKILKESREIEAYCKASSDESEKKKYVLKTIGSLLGLESSWISAVLEKGNGWNYICNAPLPYVKLLDRIAYCKKVLQITDVQLLFILKYNNEIGMPSFTDPNIPWYGNLLENLIHVVQIDNKLVIDEEDSKSYLEVLLEAKSVKDVYAFLDKATGLKTEGIMHDADLSHFRSYYGLIKMLPTLELMKKLSCTAKDFNLWSINIYGYDNELAIADDLRERIRGRYTSSKAEEWLRQIENPIREKKRDILVDLLINTEYPGNSVKFDSKADMTAYFLMDVEMNAEQDTSEIRHALSSIQMFVQRCMLNLENGVTVSNSNMRDSSSMNSWSQWNWMKNYRVWEANRKIFLFPENYLEPELRDGQSPFFQELVSEIQQNEATKENVEDALLNYLHKLDEVAKLEICGVYRQQEDLNKTIEGYEVDIFHVVARTKDAPHVYYYRTFDVNYSVWSPWEKIDIDLDGEQILPVVYNRRFYIFWLQFQKKELKPKRLPEYEGKVDSSIHDVVEYYEIQLLWTQRKKNEWTSKKISKKKMIHPWARPVRCYCMLPYLNEKANLLNLDIYLTASSEFNDNRSLNFDLYDNASHLTPKSYYNNSSYPWHSSSFEFDGDVTRVKFKDVSGSLKFVQENFGEDAAAMIPLMDGRSQLQLPPKMIMDGNRLSNGSYDDKILSISYGMRVLPYGKGAMASNSSRYDHSLCFASVLKQAHTPFCYVATLQRNEYLGYIDNELSFYQDNNRIFEIHTKNPKGHGACRFHFSAFYHPYVSSFIRELNKNGIDGLYNKYLQVKPETFNPDGYNGFDFAKSYGPSDYIGGNFPSENVDFVQGSSYGVYNWELFFHVPLTIAIRLMQNQKNEEAMKWFHYIFNPIDYVKDGSSAPECFWVTSPFRENAKTMESTSYNDQNRIEEILRSIDKHEDMLKAWRNNPFKPHIVAQQRTTAYQRQVVMKYIENLIAWGDMLFRQDTMESINEATMLYMLAHEILGLRPNKVESPYVVTNELCYKDIRASVNTFGNTTVGNGLPTYLEDNLSIDTLNFPTKSLTKLPKLDIGYFSIPANDCLETCWNSVEDRLFKIHNSLNIDGVFRKLALYEPPIDPSLLVRATAAGIGIADAVNDLNGIARCYKFRTIVQKAAEFCTDVKGLGDKLLSIHEKKDAEMLSVLRQEQEIAVLNASTVIRKQQINEAKEYIKQLNYNKECATIRYDFYSTIESMSEKEIEALSLSIKANKLEDDAAMLRTTASILSAIPSICSGIAGMGGSPTFTTQVLDGSKLSMGLDMVAKKMQGTAVKNNRSSSILTTKASYERRAAEWQLQAEISKKEIDALERQLVAAEIRLAIAEKELENHELLVENANAMYEVMTNKFSAQKLYNWMLEQTSKIYFEAYNLAYKMAKTAEERYNYELGESCSIIRPGCWDSLHEGLLAGDRLLVNIHQLEQAYLEKNTRCFELVKHVSLAEFAPKALMELISGKKDSCSFTLPDAIFDMDYKTHYMRRIKSVSITIPCVVGPSTNINCTLSINKGTYYLENGTPIEVSESGNTSSIATSSGVNDSGMFELNFNDERYLPFEGYGVDSHWTISLPKDTNFFDRSSISDVVLNVCYTAKDKGGVVAKQPVSDLRLGRLFNLKSEFPDEWYAFSHQNVSKPMFKAKVDAGRFARYLRQENLVVESVYTKSGEVVSEWNASLDDVSFEDGNLEVRMRKNQLEKTDNIYVVLNVE